MLDKDIAEMVKTLIEKNKAMIEIMKTFLFLISLTGGECS